MKRQIAALALVAGLAATANTAVARPEYGYRMTYYSDATLTVVVGHGEFTCSGRTYLYDGIATGYYVESDINECY